MDRQMMAELAQTDGLAISGEGGLLQQLTKIVLAFSLRTVLAEAGPVDIEVPRNRDDSFTPQIVRARQRRFG